MSAQRLPQPLSRAHVHADGLPPQQERGALIGDRTPDGLRLVVVARTEDGEDVIAVCDRHGRSTWFTGVLTRDQAERAVCERCREEERLHHRRALILGSYGCGAWLRVLGRG